MKLTLLFLLPLFLFACGDREPACLYGHSHGLPINDFERTECLRSEGRAERPGSWEWGGGMAWTEWEAQQHHHQHPATHDIDELSFYGAEPAPASTALPAPTAQSIYWSNFITGPHIQAAPPRKSLPPNTPLPPPTSTPTPEPTPTTPPYNLPTFSPIISN